MQEEFQELLKYKECFFNDHKTVLEILLYTVDIYIIRRRCSFYRIIELKRKIHEMRYRCFVENTSLQNNNEFKSRFFRFEIELKKKEFKNKTIDEFETNFKFLIKEYATNSNFTFLDFLKNFFDKLEICRIKMEKFFFSNQSKPYEKLFLKSYFKNELVDKLDEFPGFEANLLHILISI